MNKTLIGLTSAALVSGVVSVAVASDFGSLVDNSRETNSRELFGIRAPLGQSADGLFNIPRVPNQSPRDLIALAPGLRAEIFSREIAENWDQMSFFPNDNPTHLIGCIEEFVPESIGFFPGPDGVVGTDDGEDNQAGTEDDIILNEEAAADDVIKVTPSVQSINLATREVTTILRGMSGCDGIRTTPWGTVLATEEDGRFSFDGHIGNAYEILDPLNTENITIMRGIVFDNGTPVDDNRGTFFDEDGNVQTGGEGFGVAFRPALPEVAWEGLAILESGVLYAGDELRPGTTGNNQTSPLNGGTLLGFPDDDGGSIFKFVPDVPRIPGSGDITNLSESPFVAGDVYAARVVCEDDFEQFGQGCEKGQASWVKVDANEARRDANEFGAAGYYRPEDLALDPNFEGEGVRFCWANTGETDVLNFGEVLCGVDSDPIITADEVESDEAFGGFDTVVTSQATLDIQVFIDGDPSLNAPDNVAFQNNLSNNLYVIEDNPNGDIYACLADGNDRDLYSDGCILILSVKDRTAEPTGFLFNEAGTVAYVSIQHSSDALVLEDGSRPRSGSCPTVIEDEQVQEEFVVDDYCTDDLIRITGFRPVAQ